jgi:hypothetical protein
LGKTVRLPQTLPRSRVRLALRGFTAQSSVSADAVANAIEWLPGFHLEGLREIVYSTQDALHYPSLAPPSAAAGWAEYVQAERSVFLYRSDDTELFWHVLYHEIGHHVYFLVISSRVKKRWVTAIWPRSECATPYGSTSAAEDFAECYALYAQHTRSLEAFPAKLEFMRDEVFSGKPETLKEKRR